MLRYISQGGSASLAIIIMTVNRLTNGSAVPGSLAPDKGCCFYDPNALLGMD